MVAPAFRQQEINAEEQNVGNRTTIANQMILDTAYEMAEERRAAALNMRSIAACCRTSSKSSDSHYPRKTEFIADALVYCWKTPPSPNPSQPCTPTPGKTFVLFYKRTMNRPSDPLFHFRENIAKKAGRFCAEALCVRSRDVILMYLCRESNAAPLFTLFRKVPPGTPKLRLCHPGPLAHIQKKIGPSSKAKLPC